MKTQAEYFKASDLMSYPLSILEPLRDGLKKYCIHGNALSSEWTVSPNHPIAEFKRDIKPILKSCGLKKGNDLREKLKEYIKDSMCYYTCFNRIVSILTREINARRSPDYVMYTYSKPITGKYLKNYYKNEGIQS